MSLRTILVADEDADTRVILRTVLERCEFTVVEAANAEAAFEASQARSFELVILNYPMMGMNGETLVRRLRLSPVTRDVPILNLTSRVVPQYLLEAAADGVDVSVPKPLDVEQILNVISRLTSTRLEVHAV